MTVAQRLEPPFPLDLEVSYGLAEYSRSQPPNYSLPTSISTFTVSLGVSKVCEMTYAMQLGRL